MSRPISAEAPVAASPDEVFAFLVDLENHWQLAGPFIEVLELEGPEGAHAGGRVRIHGPLGTRRTATTTVEGATRPAQLSGRAAVGPRTEAAVTWSLSRNGAGTHVRLEARVLRAAPLDRLALALGGRFWLRRHFRSTIDSLSRRLSQGSREP